MYEEKKTKVTQVKKLEVKIGSKHLQILCKNLF